MSATTIARSWTAPTPVASLTDVVSAGRKVGVLVAPAASTLTGAFAARGHPVLRSASDSLTTGLAALLHPSPLVSVSSAFVLLRHVDASESMDSDQALCEAVHRALRAAGASLDLVTLARCEGATGAMQRLKQAYDLGEDVLLTCLSCGSSELEALAARIRFCERHQVATGFWYELRCPECGELNYKDDYQFRCPD